MMSLLDGVGLRPSRRPLALRGLRISLPRPLAWHAGVSSVYSRRPLRLAARRPLHIACSRASDEEEGPSYTAYTPEAVSALGVFASTSLAELPQQEHAKGKIQQFGGGGEDKGEQGGGLTILSDIKKAYRSAYDRVYYGDVLPPVGAYQMSYAKFLELLACKRVKRIVLLSDGRTALVEVPVENTESDFQTQTYNRRDLSITYADEQPEWMMEKNRYYVELPGDMWEEQTFMQFIKDGMERRVLMPDGSVRIPYDNMLQVYQVRPELQVMDPSGAAVWLNQYVGQFLPIVGLLGLRLVVGAGGWVLRKLGKEKKSEQEALAEALGAHKAKEYNVESKKSKKRDTGVRYTDVAGIDSIKEDISEVLDILLGRGEYKEMGAQPIRGVLLEGPPGTGKTLLAKAMAGEGGVPFYSANGAEFVEMFQGVAAARIRSLFAAARKNAPAIIFIDEIDAIGKARNDGPSDSGTQEREQGLLQLLTEMDGFVRDDQILVIGATNRASALDEALLRPGRFDRSIYMGNPSPSNRLKVLQVHARNKPIPRDNNDALLRAVADLAIGYSGAELANLLNEAAILAVRKEQSEIDLSILKEAMDKVRLGLPHTSLPDTPAKRRYATIEAARAVAFALTPGLPPIEHVTIRPRGSAVARILFVPQEFGADGGMWNQLAWRKEQANATRLDRPLTPYELACQLMVPLYAARACEEVLYGRGGVSLTTSKEVSCANELARYIVVDSRLHPLNRDSPVMTNMIMGGVLDPTTTWSDTSFDQYILALQRWAYEQALVLVQQRRAVIEAVGRELCENSDETVLGTRLVELLEATPLAEVSPDMAAAAAAAGPPGTGTGTEQPLFPGATVLTAGSSSFEPEGPGRVGSAGFERVVGADAAPAVRAGGEAAAEVLGGDLLADEKLTKLMEVVMGRIDAFDLLPAGLARTKAQQVREQLLNQAERQRLETVQAYVNSTNGAPFPAPPPVPEDKGPSLNDWATHSDDVINV